MPYVDHLVIAVDELEASAARWTAATGIAFAPGGRHPGGTENYIGLLPHQELYLELICVFEETSVKAGTHWVAGQRGPVTWACGTDDIDRDVARLRRHGLCAGAPQDGSRMCPDGTNVSWRAATIGVPGETAWPFLIQWPTSGPSRLGVADSSCDVQVKGITVGVPDPAAAAALFREVLDFRAVPGTVRAVTDGAIDVVFVRAVGGGPSPVSLNLAGRSPVATLVDGVHVLASRTRAVVR